MSGLTAMTVMLGMLTDASCWDCSIFVLCLITRTSINTTMSVCSVLSSSTPACHIMHIHTFIEIPVNGSTTVIISCCIIEPI